MVDKAAGVVVHPARGHREDTLSQLLEPPRRGGRIPSARASCIAWTATPPACSWSRAPTRLTGAAGGARRARIEREYLALVHGRPPARTGTIEAPIGRDPRVRTRMAVDGAHPREARTHFEIERALGPFTLLRVRLDTGRTHQIRVHLQAIGHPVAGDPEYGSRAGSGAFQTLGLERQFLHAAHLSFAHPLTGAPIDVVSPLPADLADALGHARPRGGAGGRLC